MAVMAAIPSSSVALVVARSASLGVGQGVVTSVGIVLGDLFFAGCAIFGMVVISEWIGTLFVVIRYLAAAYLIWFGFRLISNRKKKHLALKQTETKNINRGEWFISLLSGLGLTLADAKAILFYASLFPAFLDFQQLGATDLFIISSVIVIVVGGIKVIYAIAASKLAAAGSRIGVTSKAESLSGAAMIGVGGYLILKS